MIRIQTGKYKGKVCQTLSQEGMRPTLNRIRPAIFDVLFSQIGLGNAIFFDLFAGSGAVGIEALSRGFAKAFFWEKDPASSKILAKNTAFLPPDSYQVFAADSCAWLDQACQAADFFVRFKNQHKLIPPYTAVWFFDPPYLFYQQAFFDRLLGWAKTFPFDQDSWWVVQGPRPQTSVALSAGGSLELVRSKVYGKQQLDFYRFPSLTL